MYLIQGVFEVHLLLASVLLRYIEVSFCTGGTDLSIVLYLHNFWLSGKLGIMGWGGFVCALDTSNLVSI